MRKHINQVPAYGWRPKNATSEKGEGLGCTSVTRMAGFCVSHAGCPSQSLPAQAQCLQAFRVSGRRTHWPAGNPSTAPLGTSYRLTHSSRQQLALGRAVPSQCLCLSSLFVLVGWLGRRNMAGCQVLLSSTLRVLLGRVALNPSDLLRQSHVKPATDRPTTKYKAQSCYHVAQGVLRTAGAWYQSPINLVGL